jgi:hypothetical protein
MRVIVFPYKVLSDGALYEDSGWQNTLVWKTARVRITPTNWIPIGPFVQKNKEGRPFLEFAMDHRLYDSAGRGVGDGMIFPLEVAGNIESKECQRP